MSNRLAMAAGWVLLVAVSLVWAQQLKQKRPAKQGGMAGQKNVEDPAELQRKLSSMPRDKEGQAAQPNGAGDLKPLKLVIRLWFGMLGPNIVSCDYCLSPPAK